MARPPSRRLPLRISLAAGLFLSAKAHAVLVETDLFEAGDGLVTRDTDSSLDWLDATATLDPSACPPTCPGLYPSFNEILGAAGGWAAAGWRHATLTEVCDLFITEGIASAVCDTIISVDSTVPADIARVVNLEALLGVTSGGGPGDSQANTDGLFDDDGGSIADFAGVAGLRVKIPPNEVRIRTFSDDTPVDETSDAVGHMLVRAVPVPTREALGLSALVAVAALRRGTRTTTHVGTPVGFRAA